MRGSALECVGVHWDAWECTGMHESALAPSECTGMRGSALECVGVHWDAWEYTGMRGSALGWMRVHVHDAFQFSPNYGSDSCTFR